MDECQKLWETIKVRAQELGLVFVDGPNPFAINPDTNYRPSSPDYYQVSGQQRAGFAFSVVKI
jgi:hypothetical protein